MQDTCLYPPVKLPLNLALLQRAATRTTRSWSVWFCNTTLHSALSPKLRNLGKEGRTIKGNLATTVSSPNPNCRPVTATAHTRYLVSESGNLNSTETLPCLSVTTDGVKFAMAAKLLRTSIGVEASSCGALIAKLDELDLGEHSSFSMHILSFASLLMSAIGLAMDLWGAGDGTAIFFDNVAPPPPGAAILSEAETGTGTCGSGGFGTFSANFCKSSELQEKIFFSVTLHRQLLIAYLISKTALLKYVKPVPVWRWGLNSDNGLLNE